MNQLAAYLAFSDNQAMSMPQDQLFEFALSLPQADRADLVFRLLQSLVPPGDEVSAAEFGAELHERIAAHRRGEIPSYSLDETRTIIQQRLSQRAHVGEFLQNSQV